VGRVTFRVVGCGDAFGSGGRNNTCFLVDDDIGRFAIDFGATSPVALNAQGITLDTIDVIFLTHLHGDHFGGLPFLLLMRQYASDQVRPLTIAGPPGLKARIAALVEAMFPGMWTSDWSFPLHFIEIEPSLPVEILGRVVLTQPVSHYAGPEQSRAIRIETSDQIIAFSGDTGWNECLIDLAQGADLFLCDCFDRHDQPFEGHLSYDTLMKHKSSIKADRLLLTHLGPEMINASEGLEIESAKDGMVIYFDNVASK